MMPTFQWTTFDVSGMFPHDWEMDIYKAAASAEFRDFPRTPVISREAADVQRIPRGRVHAYQVQQGLPWLHQLYRTSFLELAQRVGLGPVMAAGDERYGVVLNVQLGTEMRFECHVDSNSLTALLFFTDHGRSEGGELVIAHDRAATSIAEIDHLCAVLRPQAGHLVFFDGRTNPHYVRPLSSDAHTRIVAVMNYYTQSCPESQRPRELNRHLYGET
jgi:2OG-Fe(II) oxygenase superfamily